jgi:carnitine O-acetyltransferase
MSGIGFDTKHPSLLTLITLTSDPVHFCERVTMNTALIRPSVRRALFLRTCFVPPAPSMRIAPNIRSTGRRPLTSTSDESGWIQDGDTGRSFFEATGDYRSQAGFEDPNLPLYEHQASLPRLPVPSVEETLTRLLPTALPLAESDEETVSLQAACRSFSAQAAVLQERLLDRKQTFSDSSYLQQWWNKGGYLEPRVPNAIGISYFFRLADTNSATTPDGHGGGAGRAVERAAAVLQATHEYASTVQSGSKPADTLGRKKVPLCSTQYKYLFGACRIPGVEQDSVRVYRPTEMQHAVLACRGQFYKVPLTDNKGNALARSALQSLVRDCITESKKQHGTVPLLGWLTSSRRDDWAQTYQRLSQHEEMKEALDTLQSGLVVLALDVDDDEDDNSNSNDYTQPLSDREQALRYWHGNVDHSANRWFDKSIQLVVSQQGAHLGLIGEHSMADGMPAVGFAEYLMEREKQSADVDVHDNESSASSPTSGVHVTNIFAHAMAPGKLGNDEQHHIMNRVNDAREHMTQRIQDLDLETLSYQGYGSNAIKQAGYSPDAYVQMAMQVAGYRLFGKQIGTYEALQTRPFLHGRTETARSVSTASAALVQAMGPNVATTVDETALAKKRALLQAAVDAHAQYCRMGADGLGVDRHLFGLSMLVAEGEAAPDLFSHPLFLRSKRWRMSTSTLPNVAPGFGPVEEDGVGVAYDLRPESCIFTITSQKQNAYVYRMSDLIAEALEELKALASVESVPMSRL